MKKAKHRIVYDQEVRAKRVAKARRRGMTMQAAVLRYGGGANRITVWNWLRKYTTYYGD